MAINPFSSLQPPDSGSEQIVQAKPAALDEAVEKAYKVYEGLGIVSTNCHYLLGGNVDIEPIRKLETQILLPNQIKSLMQVIISEANSEILTSDLLGIYLTRLIQDSYNGGYNDFVLNTVDTIICDIGQLEGEQSRKINLRIEGRLNHYCVFCAANVEITLFGCAGEFFGSGARYSKLVVSGGVQIECGSNAKYSEIIVEGDAGACCGVKADHSTITILGNVSDSCMMEAKNSRLNVFGKVGEGCGCGAYNTIFTAHNKQAYHMFKRYVEKRKGNTIQLVDSSGKIIKEEHL